MKTTIGSLMEEALQSFQDLGFSFKTTTNPGFPKIEVVGDDDKVIVTALVAGYKKEELTVEFRNDLLTISSLGVLSENNPEASKVYYTEIKRGSFQRSIYINPKLIDTTKMVAKVENGVLTVELPRREQELHKQTYRIPIQ